ncbi:metal ABC transporter ATP-binding protein [candidate division KSB1 bacterium]
MENNDIISIKGASFGYGRKTILEDVNFSILKSDFIAFLGPNGAGKSTLMKAIMQQIKPLLGTVALNKDIKIGYVPQIDTEGSFWPLKVRDFVDMFQQERCCTVEDVLSSLNIEKFADKVMQDLSGGQRQRVQLAKALINHPDLLILDEPTDGMDVSAEADYLELLKDLNRNGTTIVLVSHHLYDVLSVAKKIVIVNNGTTVITDTDSLMNNRILDKLYDRPFLTGRVGSSPIIIPAERG